MLLYWRKMYVLETRQFVDLMSQDEIKKNKKGFIFKH